MGQEVIDRRVTAAIEGDFVVFLIGMRVNKLWKVWKWLPTFLAMPRMIRELEGRPESGFLGADQYAAGRRATAEGRAGIREEPYPAGAPTERIDV